MVRQWQRRAPWRYYPDLWLQPRGQWLATFLGLGALESTRPVLCLSEADRHAAGRLSRPYAVLAPHIGQYSMPVVGTMWRRIKEWPWERWMRLARLLRLEGYTPITLAGTGQTAIPGTIPLIGLPIRQAAGVIERAAVLVSGESGLWFIAAALRTPFAIVPWWLPRSIDWAAPAQVPYRLVYRDEASVNYVLEQVRELVAA
jgi:ADP-heptose:LPS heptosyltransferase